MILHNDYSITYNALAYSNTVYNSLTQNGNRSSVTYFFTFWFIRNVLIFQHMYKNVKLFIKWFYFDFLKTSFEFLHFIMTVILLDSWMMLLVQFNIVPTPKFCATYLKWHIRFIIVSGLLFLFLLPKENPNLMYHPHGMDLQTKQRILKHRSWVHLAENKRLWNNIKQTQNQILGINQILQTELKDLQRKLDTVHTWENITSTMVIEQLHCINASIEQRIQEAVNKSMDSVLIQFINGKIILSPLMVSLLHSNNTRKEIIRLSQHYLGPQLTIVLNDLIDIKKIEVISIIDQEIQKYHQDDINKADYALKSRGGSILHHSPGYSDFPWLSYFFGDSDINTIIRPGNYAGECWSMKGSSGTIAVLLSENIQIDSITIEYPSPQIMLTEMMNAPRDMIIYGSLFTFSWHPIGQIRYDVHGQSIQTFKINNSDALVYNKVLIEIISNWGNEIKTDIYRIRIHGKPILPFKKSI